MMDWRSSWLDKGNGAYRENKFNGPSNSDMDVYNGRFTSQRYKSDKLMAQTRGTIDAKWC